MNLSQSIDVVCEIQKQSGALLIRKTKPRKLHSMNTDENIDVISVEDSYFAVVPKEVSPVNKNCIKLDYKFLTSFNSNDNFA